MSVPLTDVFHFLFLNPINYTELSLLTTDSKNVFPVVLVKNDFITTFKKGNGLESILLCSVVQVYSLFPHF